MGASRDEPLLSFRELISEPIERFSEEIKTMFRRYLFVERPARRGRAPPRLQVGLRASTEEIKTAIAEITDGRLIGADALHEQIQKLLPHRHVRRADVRRLNGRAPSGRPRRREITPKF